MPAFNSAQRIIEDAMVDAGLLQEGQTPTPDQYDRYQRRLNDVINLLQTSGLKLWLQVDRSIPLTAGKQTYSIMPGGDLSITKPMRIQQGYYLDSSSGRRPIYPLSWDEWLRLSQINQTGSITQYFVDKQQDRLNVSFWNIPDAMAATGQAHLLIQGQVTNIISITDTMNFPMEWFIALRWGLADEICTGQPQSIMQRCTQRAMMYREALEAWDVEDASTYYAVDQRTGPSGRFL